MSHAATLKYVLKCFKVGDNETAIKLVLHAGVKAGTLKQAKGTSATADKKATKPKKDST